MKTLLTPKKFIYYDPVLLSEPVQHIFDDNYWKQKNAITGSAQGRGTTWFVQTKVIEAALRHYRRGGLLGKIIKDGYLFFSWEKTRSLQEFKLLEELIRDGVHVPRPIAARAIKKGFYYQADLLSEKIPNAEDLVSILQSQSLSCSLYSYIGHEIRKMHNAQVDHTDLNIHNILIDKSNKVWIIDFDKCTKRVGDSWKGNNLTRLRRSFLKEVKKRNIHWSESDWTTLIQSYHK
ncbi:3-deoxy-D-manno-octulosonic acid kinase [Psychromonas sp. MB-3u-54]|uniref:3-deoxy-D-manno-octulosonic acid kinase n=1 Tax=Psychromonas sp. MB-3u-54 TaxID=2058319 RepID=UPI000C333873|nr:3-deoxy-D-manno-octulosonic acid kinase [Psychromonas sp. MB-3u-54]PKH01599.1 3-deoxy-D-manno-octulosonic acid kinase [Psychromonas sp. MB-3u-54]